MGCRLDHAKQWQARLLHEARTTPNAIFLTATYDEDHLPPSLSLDKRAPQLFFKRWRKHISPTKIRYYLAGEYGELLRPHYHAIVYGYTPPDAILETSTDGNPFFSSAVLTSLWGQGFVNFGLVTPETCAYVARYVTKKISGPPAKDHYSRWDSKTGEVWQVLPEYGTMSRRPGIGSAYFDQYHADVFPDDFIIINGRKTKTPRFYDKLLERRDPELLEEIKTRRADVTFTRSFRADNKPARLAAKAECLASKMKTATKGKM